MVDDISIKKEESLKEEARKISIKEGSCTSLMDGFGNRYITPYALILGASNTQIGLLSSLPTLIGSFAQIMTLKFIRKVPRKKIVTKFVLLQALMWIPIIAVGYFYFFQQISIKLAASALVLFYAALIFFGSIAGPAWSSWVKDIVDKDRGMYFSKRNKITTTIVLASILISGLILEYFDKVNNYFGFVIIFSIAMIGRLASSYLFTKKYEPKHVYDEKSFFTFRQFVKKMANNNFGRFVIFVSLISFSTLIASPFFAVYMLKDLQLSYISFTVINLSPLLATFLFLPSWGRFSDKYGNVKILKITSALIPAIPALWLLAPFLRSNYFTLIIFLTAVELLSGFIWAGLNHATATFIYDAVTSDKISICVAYFNVFNTFGSFIGALVGGFIASKSFTFFGFSAILVVFMISALLRIAVFLIMSPFVHEVKEVKDFSLKRKIFGETEKATAHFWEMIGFKAIRIRQNS